MLLHGWGVQAWKQVAGELSARFTVHVVDFPGYGQSPYVNPCTPRALVQALAAVAPSPVHVCGWSLGGQIALQWALNIPHQIKRLILVATTPRFRKCEDWEYGIEAAVLDKFASDLASDREATLKRFFALVAQGDRNAKHIAAKIRQVAFSGTLPETKALRAGLKFLADTDLRDTVHRIQHPCLLIHGDRDRVTPLGAAQWLAATLPHAQLEVAEGCAHAPFLSDPSAFVGMVSGYLDD